MKQPFATAVFLFLGFVFVSGSLLDEYASARQKKEPSRVLTVKQMMSGLVKPNKASLETALKEPPAEDAAWEALVLNAALLNESGYILVDGDRSPDKIWTEASRTLRDESAVLLAALNAKDYDASSAAFKKLTTACAACHKAHLKK